MYYPSYSNHPISYSYKDSQFKQQISVPSEERYEQQRNQTSYRTNCNHQKKIIQLKQKIKQLEFQQKYLMKTNDQILQNLKQNNQRQIAQQKQNQMWKLKYQQLKAENDRKSLRLANLATGSILANRNLNNQKEFQNKQKFVKKESLTYKSAFQSKLTKQQKQYVNYLQNQKRMRSASLRVIQPSSAKRYSATLPDGLVIHIVDNRAKTQRNHRQ